MTSVKKKYAKNERRVKTVTPVAVFDIDELDRILNALGMLIGMENQTSQTRVNIKANARNLQADLRNYRRSLTEYFKLAD